MPRGVAEGSRRKSYGGIEIELGMRDGDGTEKENARILTPGVESRVSSTFLRRAGPTAQRGFNYADITVIKPINACHCAREAEGPSIIPSPARESSAARAAQKHLTSSWRCKDVSTRSNLRLTRRMEKPRQRTGRRI